MLRTRCELDVRAMIESETDAQKAWSTLDKLKPWGSAILTSTFRKLDNVSLAGCDNDPKTYANKFMEVLEELNALSSKLYFDENWKIYRFHSGLGSVHDSYCEQYNQTHDAFDDNGKHKYDLNYAITRFIGTMANPTISAETQALAALVNGTFAYTPQSVMALVAADGAEIKIQPGANAGNSRTYVQTCKYCTHCKKDWHDNSECTTLHPHLESRRKNNRFGG